MKRAEKLTKQQQHPLKLKIGAKMHQLYVKQSRTGFMTRIAALKG